MYKYIISEILVFIISWCLCFVDYFVYLWVECCRGKAISSFFKALKWKFSMKLNVVWGIWMGGLLACFFFGGGVGSWSQSKRISKNVRKLLVGGLPPPKKKKKNFHIKKKNCAFFTSKYFMSL